MKQKPLEQFPRLVIPQVDSEIMEYIVEYMNQRLSSETITSFTLLDELRDESPEDREFLMELTLAALYFSL